MKYFHILLKMSKSYLENVNIFYPQNDNPHYSEEKAIHIAWIWLIEICNNDEHLDSRQKLRALLSTTSRKVHRIAYMMKELISIKHNNGDYNEVICNFLNN